MSLTQPCTLLSLSLHALSHPVASNPFLRLVQTTMASKSSVATVPTKKVCKPVEFHRDVSKNGFPFTRVTGMATYYLRQKLKTKGARWNPIEKQWQIWGGALEMAFMKELEADAEAAMPQALAHEQRKNAAKEVPVALEAPKTIEEMRGTPYYDQLRSTAYQQLIAEGHPAWGPDTAEIYTHKHFDARGNLVILAVNERMQVLHSAAYGAAAPAASGAAASAASGAAASGAAAPAASGAAASGAAAPDSPLSASAFYAGEARCRECERCELMPGQSCKVPHCMTTNCGLCNEIYKTQSPHNCPELIALGF